MRRQVNRMKKCCITVLAMLLAAGSIAPITARAGLETGETYANSFDFGALDGVWVSENAVVEADAGQQKGLRFVNASEGAGIVTQEEISANKIRMEIDVEHMDLSTGGWLGFLLGTKDAPTIMNWSNLADGKHIMLSYINGVWHLCTQTKNSDGTYVGYNLVDANGSAIQSGTSSDSRHYYKLAGLPGNRGVLSNVTLIVTLDNQGNFTFSMREFGNTAETLLAQTKDKKLDPYTTGRLGVCVMQGSKGISGKLTNVKTYVNGNTKATTEFRFNQDDIGSDYLMDFSVNTSSMTYDALGKLKMTATAKKVAYAINKTPVQIDSNVVNYALAKNILVEQDLYLTDFREGAVFSLCFGLGNSYDTEIGAKDSYALKIMKKSGQNVFSVVKYTEDNASKSTAVIGQTAFEQVDGKVPILIAIDGNGSLEVTVGNQSKKAANQLSFAKNKMYFGYELRGTAVVKIDAFSIHNALYSKPSNKDLMADFTDNDINVNEWYLPTWGGNLEERYDGVYAENNELVFKNVNSNAGITTKAQFSNFELTFDITDIQRDEKNGIRPSSDIRIMYGISGYTDGFNILYYQELRPIISFRSSDSGTGYSILHVDKELAGTLPEQYDMFSEASKGKVFSVKLTMMDGLLTLYLKTFDEKNFTKIAETQTAGALTGSIRISGYGDGTLGDGTCSNFRIDNLSVKNTDKEPNNTNDYGYKSNKAWITWDGYEYVDTWDNDDLLPIEAQQNKRTWILIIVLAGGAIALAAVTGVSIFVIRRRKSNEQE